jgi:uncharacterized protein (TIGR02996 family)
MPTEADLLAGIVAHPGELDRWLVLADWLEDQQDHRAELARLRFLLQTEPDHPDRIARLSRQQALLESGLAPVVPTWTNSIGIEFALLLPGTFPMGSPDTEAERQDDEVLHPVTLTQPFLLGVYPCTVGAFQRFVAATGYTTEAEEQHGAYGYVGGRWTQNASITWRSPGCKQTDQHPVVCVSWNDAQAMVAWFNQVEADCGVVYSLPTEAEWEYACRAGTTTAYAFGDAPDRLGDFAWFGDGSDSLGDFCNSDNKTHPVTTKKPNAWGLWHMHGLVWEWCADWYEEYLPTVLQDPSGPSEGSSRVIRGGSWSLAPAYGRSAHRGGGPPAVRFSNRGFRLAASVRVG